MPSITFSSDHLRKLMLVNSYPFSHTAMMVFGIRGASPAGSDFDTFKNAHQLEKTDFNHQTPRCTIGLWKPAENKLALFPGSTVPHLSYIRKHLAKTAKANCMMSGFYRYYEKGYHNPSPAGAHPALRLATNIVLRRSNNDLVFGNDDPIEVGNPHDNIHAAYCNSLSDAYSSAGCQVIVGQPKCQRRGSSPNTGFWKKFHDFIYNETGQQKFEYALFRFADAEAAHNAGTAQMEARLRFGSQSNTVLELQKKLHTAGYFNTNKDGDFGKNTLMAVMAYQKDTFGANAADGVVGGNTAGSLGLTLPRI